MPSLPFSQTRYLGWSVSILVHGIVWGVIAVFNFQPPPPRAELRMELFRWEVSLLAAPPAEAAVADGMQSSAEAPAAETPIQALHATRSLEPRFEETVAQEHTDPSAAPLQTASRVMSVSDAVSKEADALPRAAIMPATIPAESLLPPPEVVEPQRDSSHLLVETQPELVTVFQRPPSITRPVVNRTVLPDYTWLMETLRAKLEHVKVYPPSAKSSQLQGRVVVQVSIHGDGRMTDSGIEESSGYPMLDQAALDAIRAASPLKLTHLLDGPPVVMLVPLNYQLE